jgi:hypothetical protein
MKSINASESLQAVTAIKTNPHRLCGIRPAPATAAKEEISYAAPIDMQGDIGTEFRTAMNTAWGFWPNVTAWQIVGADIQQPNQKDANLDPKKVDPVATQFPDMIRLRAPEVIGEFATQG